MVLEILKNPLSRWTFPEKLKVVRRGRPTSTLASLSQPRKGFVLHVQTSAYERYHGLAASEEQVMDLVFGVTEFANLSCLTKAKGNDWISFLDLVYN